VIPKATNEGLRPLERCDVSGPARHRRRAGADPAVVALGSPKPTFLFDGGMSSRINLEAVTEAKLGYVTRSRRHAPNVGSPSWPLESR